MNPPQSSLVQIFLPNGCESASGFLLGWWLHDSSAVVADVLQEANPKVPSAAEAPQILGELRGRRVWRKTAELKTPEHWLVLRGEPLRLLQLWKDGEVMESKAVQVRSTKKMGSTANNWNMFMIFMIQVSRLYARSVS